MIKNIYNLLQEIELKIIFGGDVKEFEPIVDKLQNMVTNLLEGSISGTDVEKYFETIKSKVENV